MLPNSGGASFRGTSLGQDTRFSDKNKKLLKSMSFPKEFQVKVDLSRCDLKSIEDWVDQQITHFLGVDDEVVVSLIMNSLVDAPIDFDPKTLMITLAPFLEQDTRKFVRSLWKLLISAQNSASGIPPELISHIGTSNCEKIAIESKISTMTRERDSSNTDEPSSHRTYSSPRKRYGRSPSSRSPLENNRDDRYSRSQRHEERRSYRGSYYRDRNETPRYLNRTPPRHRSRQRSRTPPIMDDDSILGEEQLRLKAEALESMRSKK